MSPTQEQAEVTIFCRMPQLYKLNNDTIEMIMFFCNFSSTKNRSSVRLCKPGELTHDQMLQMTSTRISVCNRNALCAFWTKSNGQYKKDGSWVPGEYYETRYEGAITKVYNSKVELILVCHTTTRDQIALKYCKATRREILELNYPGWIDLN